MSVDSPTATDTTAVATAAAVGRVDLHARVMELFFVVGDGATLTVEQVASILGADRDSVAAELRSNQFADLDEQRGCVRLRRAGGAAGGTGDSTGTGRRRPSPPLPAERHAQFSYDSVAHDGVAAAAESSGDSDEAEWAGDGPLRGPQRRGGSVEDGSGGGGGGGDRRPPSARPGGHSYRLRRNANAVRIGSRAPPLPFPSGRHTTGAGAGGAHAPAVPSAPLLTGRVGYACVAEEFRLAEMQQRYDALGYFTNFDFGVLHVRLPEREVGLAEGARGKDSDSTGRPAAAAKGRAARASAAAGRVSGGVGGGHSAQSLVEGGDGGEVGGDAAPAAAPPPSSPVTAQYIMQRRCNFDLFIFDYGAVVWWGSDPRFFKIVESDFLLPDSGAAPYMVSRYPTALVHENYPVWCSYALVRKESFDVDDDFRNGLRYDHFIIPFGRDGEDSALSATTMLCCAHALAQSAKIDYLELRVQGLAEACAPLPQELRARGRASISERHLLQRRAELLTYRLMLKSGSDLLDEPDLFWENAYLTPMFEAAKEAFGITDRVEALDNKLDATNDILSMLAEDFTQRHGARLEWIVIWLVFVEVIIGVLELAVDFKPWFQ